MEGKKETERGQSGGRKSHPEGQHLKASGVCRGVLMIAEVSLSGASQGLNLHFARCFLREKHDFNHIRHDQYGTWTLFISEENSRLNHPPYHRARLVFSRFVLRACLKHTLKPSRAKGPDFQESLRLCRIHRSREKWENKEHVYREWNRGIRSGSIAWMQFLSQRIQRDKDLLRSLWGCESSSS